MGIHYEATFFEVFDINPLFMYVLAAVLSILLNSICITYTGATIGLMRFACKESLQLVQGDYTGLLAYAVFCMFSIDKQVCFI